MTILLRLFAWLLAIAVTVVTLGPPRYRPHSHLGQLGEHILAFILVGLAFALAYPRRRLAAAALTVGWAGALEFLQLFVPGRHARVEDLIADGVAALAGFAIVAGLDLVTARLRHG